MVGEISARPVVVLGFGAAGTNAVMALREAGYQGHLVVVTDASAEPYSPVLTSYYAGGRIGREQCFIWAGSCLENLVDDMRTHARIRAIDVAAHEVVLEGERIGYSKLVVATGAHPVAPGFPQVEGRQLLVLRTMEDADRLRQALESTACKKVLVSGTSMVGLKALEACLDRGVHATLLGRSSHIMRNAAHPLVAEQFQELLAERGVALRLGQTVASAENEARGAGCVVAFSDGQTERFDEVVLAQGVAPNLDFVGDALQVDKGLLVDEFMRTSAPDVYAAGDVAQALDMSTGERRVIGLWQNAVQQGRCAGRAIAAELAGHAPTRPFPGSLPCNTIHVRDILFASVGSVREGEGWHCEVCRDDSSLRVLVYEGDGTERRLVGVNVLLAVSAEGGTDSLDCEIGGYRREIMNAYL